MMGTEIVKTEHNANALATVMGVSPETLLDYATKVSMTLTKALREQGMTRKFGTQGEHVQTEGWQLAGSLMGFVTTEKDVLEHQDGSFTAKVALKSLKSQTELVEATGYCGVDEPNWRGKPKYARRSMAITRAIGRAYAQNFRWLIKMAGFEGTPAEEMDGISPEIYNGRDDHKSLLRAAGAEAGVEDEDILREVHRLCLRERVPVANLVNAVKDFTTQKPVS